MVKKLCIEQTEQFKKDGLLFVPSHELWDPVELNLILTIPMLVEQIDDHRLMKYYETVTTPDHGEKRVLQRIENFIETSECLPLYHLLNGCAFLSIVSQLFNALQPFPAQALLHKEKINYKLPFGDGYKPHQDIAAGWWMYGQTLHISVYISIDEATKENGALELVKGEHTYGLIGEPFKELPADYCEQKTWEMYETTPGDILFFTSFVPHRSGPNLTNTSRRILYMTYSMAHEGNFRSQYYTDKRKSFPPENERIPGQLYEYKI